MKPKQSAFLLCVVFLSVIARGQDYTWTTNADNTLTITGYTGSGGDVTIPDTINGMTVTSIGDGAFYRNNNFTSVTIPDSVTNIGADAFFRCGTLSKVVIGNGVAIIGDNAFTFEFITNVTIPNSVTIIGNGAFAQTWITGIVIPTSVTNLGDGAFSGCPNLASVTIPNNMNSISNDVFSYCSSLSSVTIPGSVTNIGDNAFYSCTGLNSIYFEGNAPSMGASVFGGGNDGLSYQTPYYLPGTTGWVAFDAESGAYPAVLWNPQVQMNDGNFGVGTNGFGFNITGTSNLVVVVEACTDLANLVWSPVSTNMLDTFIGTNGISYFSDPQWTNYPSRFYRIRSP